MIKSRSIELDSIIKNTVVRNMKDRFLNVTDSLFSL